MMNAKANSIGIAQAVMLSARTRGLDGALAPRALTHATVSSRLVLSSERRPCIGLRSAERRVDEIGETLAYLVMWLSGLAGIGLCLGQ